jgi:hypothetical protein
VAGILSAVDTTVILGRGETNASVRRFFPKETTAL